MYTRTGWDRLRAERQRRLIESGLVDDAWRPASRDSRVPAWDEAEHKAWEAERMAVYAAPKVYAGDNLPVFRSSVRIRAKNPFSVESSHAACVLPSCVMILLPVPAVAASQPRLESRKRSAASNCVPRPSRVMSKGRVMALVI